MDCIRHIELTMAADPIESVLDAERVYWQTRLAHLELLLCELLVKNERLRQERLRFTPGQPEQESARTDFWKS